MPSLPRLPPLAAAILAGPCDKSSRLLLCLANNERRNATNIHLEVPKAGKHRTIFHFFFFKMPFLSIFHPSTLKQEEIDTFSLNSYDRVTGTHLLSFLLMHFPYFHLLPKNEELDAFSTISKYRFYNQPSSFFSSDAFSLLLSSSTNEALETFSFKFQWQGYNYAIFLHSF